MPNFHAAYSENDTLMERPNNPGGVIWETPEEFYIGSPELPPQRGGYSGFTIKKNIVPRRGTTKQKVKL